MNSTPEPKPVDAVRLDSLSIAAQLANRREAASRCEPFDCGHRDPLDCVAAQHNRAPTPPSAPAPEAVDVDPDVLTALWADAKIAWSARDFPKYGSREWIALTPDDPRRLAGALEAAEMWRKYGDEEALLAWFRDASRARPSIAARRTRAELDEAAKPKPPHQLQATAGWPPIAVPGKPGVYLTYTQQRREAA